MDISTKKKRVLNYLETGILAKSVVSIVLFGQENIIHSTSKNKGSR